MTADEGNVMKKSAAVVAGLVLALGGAAAPAFADSGANGAAIGSPGFLSGNVVQLPIHLPVNVCGNTSNVTALLNPTAGNVCVND
ncbi:chaplin [Streptomyces bobili]|uniref:chaplin n=1 Tax=Streptomyces bobili TaxID=67280 RepID=UPI00341ED22B